MENLPIQFEGCKVFSATLARDRDALGDTVTRWLAENKDKEIVKCKVKQSSDNEFHCLSIFLFFRTKQ